MTRHAIPASSLPSRRALASPRELGARRVLLHFLLGGCLDRRNLDSVRTELPGRRVLDAVPMVSAIAWGRRRPAPELTMLFLRRPMTS